MWTLLAVAVQIGVVFPAIATLAGRWAGLPAPVVRWGTGPPVARGVVGGVRCELGALPLGASVTFGEDLDLPFGVLVAPHLSTLLLAAAAAGASPEPTRRAAVRVWEWLRWADAPYGPVGAIGHAWRSDAVDPVGTAAAVVLLMSCWNLWLATAQWIGWRAPPVGIGLLLAGFVVMARACGIEAIGWIAR